MEKKKNEDKVNDLSGDEKDSNDEELVLGQRNEDILQRRNTLNHG